jgi:hypothetical protein
MHLGKPYFSSSDDLGGRLSPIRKDPEELNHTRQQLRSLSLNVERSICPDFSIDGLNQDTFLEKGEKEIQKVIRQGFQKHAHAMQGKIDRIREIVDRIAINQNLLQAEVLDQKWEWPMFKTRRKYIFQVGKDGNDEIVSKSISEVKYKRLAKEILRRCAPDNEAAQTFFGNEVSREVFPGYHFQCSIVSQTINYFHCSNYFSNNMARQLIPRFAGADRRDRYNPSTSST